MLGNLGGGARQGDGHHTATQKMDTDTPVKHRTRMDAGQAGRTEVDGLGYAVCGRRDGFPHRGRPAHCGGGGKSGIRSCMGKGHSCRIDSRGKGGNRCRRVDGWTAAEQVPAGQTVDADMPTGPEKQTGDGRRGGSVAMSELRHPEACRVAATVTCNNGCARCGGGCAGLQAAPCHMAVARPLCAARPRCHPLLLLHPLPLHLHTPAIPARAAAVDASPSGPRAPTSGAAAAATAAAALPPAAPAGHGVPQGAPRGGARRPQKDEK